MLKLAATSVYIRICTEEKTSSHRRSPAPDTPVVLVALHHDISLLDQSNKRRVRCSTKTHSGQCEESASIMLKARHRTFRQKILFTAQVAVTRKCICISKTRFPGEQYLPVMVKQQVAIHPLSWTSYYNRPR